MAFDSSPWEYDYLECPHSQAMDWSGKKSPGIQAFSAAWWISAEVRGETPAEQKS